MFWKSQSVGNQFCRDVNIFKILTWVAASKAARETELVKDQLSNKTVILKKSQNKNNKIENLLGLIFFKETEHYK